jgi:hypothetical protein
MLITEKKLLLPLFCFVAFAIAIALFRESVAVSISEKDMYSVWLKIDEIEQELESPQGAKDLLDAESCLLECGEKFKEIVAQSEDENFKDWATFAEVFAARNKAVLDYIEALKNYEKSEKFQRYENLLKKYQKVAFNAEKKGI